MAETRVEFYDLGRDPPPFEGVRFSERMADGKLGAYCKNKTFCLIAGGCETELGLREAVALGRWNGITYSALCRVPPPFFVRIDHGAKGKSPAEARNIVNRLVAYMNKGEGVMLREYMLEMERFGARYVAG